jgi:hypothetical protein
MTPEEQFKEIRAILEETARRLENTRQNHESWLLDMQSAFRELHASQQVTEERLQRLIRALTPSTNGRP